jgi:hypothetical protein
MRNKDAETNGRTVLCMECGCSPRKSNRRRVGEVKEEKQRWIEPAAQTSAPQRTRDADVHEVQVAGVRRLSTASSHRAAHNSGVANMVNLAGVRSHAHFLPGQASPASQAMPTPRLVKPRRRHKPCPLHTSLRQAQGISHALPARGLVV